VGDDHELGETGELADDVREAADVRVVERGVELVEHAQRRGLHHVDGEKQGHGGHRLLAARKQRDAAELGAGGWATIFDAALERVLGLDHGEVAAPPTKRRSKVNLKFLRTCSKVSVKSLSEV
jgi:hypothetical protein